MDYSVHDVYPLPEVYGQQLRVLVPNCKPICCEGSPTHSTKSQKLIKTRKKKKGQMTRKLSDKEANR